MNTPTDYTTYGGKQRLKAMFQRVLDLEDYKKLTHFVFLHTEFKKEIPGTYCMYHMHKDGLAIATNALCINEWLKLHDMPVRPKINDYKVQRKLLHNQDERIDNRTEERVNMQNKRGRKPGIPNNFDPSADLTANIWSWHSAGLSSAKISRRLGVTPAAVYYHIKKYKKANPDYIKEFLEVDNT